MNMIRYVDISCTSKLCNPEISSRKSTSLPFFLPNPEIFDQVIWSQPPFEMRIIGICAIYFDVFLVDETRKSCDRLNQLPFKQLHRDL